jgi:hypothetical protein
MSRQALDELKQQISLWDYLQAHDWRPARQHPGAKMEILADVCLVILPGYTGGKRGDWT